MARSAGPGCRKSGRKQMLKVDLFLFFAALPFRLVSCSNVMHFISLARIRGLWVD